jgi:aspartate kinase
MVFRLMNIGPTALDSGDSLYQIAGVLAAQSVTGARLVAVVPAMSGVTDLLLDSIRLGNYSNVYTKLLTSHKNAARRQGKDETARQVLIQDVTDMLDSYTWLGKSLANRGPTPSEQDTILLMGERLSARLLAASLQNRGVQTVALNASELLVRLNGLPTPDPAATRERAQSRLLPLLDQGSVVVVTASLDAESAQAAAHRKHDTPSLCAAALIAAAAPDEVWSWLDGEHYDVRGG